MYLMLLPASVAMKNFPMGIFREPATIPATSKGRNGCKARIPITSGPLSFTQFPMFLLQSISLILHMKFSFSKTLRPNKPAKYPPNPPTLTPMAAASPTINGFQIVAAAKRTEMAMAAGPKGTRLTVTNNQKLSGTLSRQR